MQQAFHEALLSNEKIDDFPDPISHEENVIFHYKKGFRGEKHTIKANGGFKKTT